jgi:hypothetical protein
LESTVSVLITKTTSEDDFLAGAAAEAVGHAGLRGPLPIELGDFSTIPASALTIGSSSSEVGKKSMDTSAPEGLPSTTASTGPDVALNFSGNVGEDNKLEKASLAVAVKNITGLLTCKEVKVLQKAVIALGHLCYGNPKSELLDASLSALFTLGRSKVRAASHEFLVLQLRHSHDMTASLAD